MHNQFVVIVNQGVPEKLDGYSAYGPFDDEGVAEEVMGMINGLAMEGMFTISSVLVAPFFMAENQLTPYIKELMNDA